MKPEALNTTLQSRLPGLEEEDQVEGDIDYEDIGGDYEGGDPIATTTINSLSLQIRSTKDKLRRLTNLTLRDIH
jgi:hypothetical protein